MPFSSREARTKASIGLRTHCCCFTVGTSGRASRVQGQLLEPPPARSAAPSAGFNRSIQAAIRLISPSVSREPLIGMAGSVSPLSLAIKGLAALLPAITAGPSSAPPSSRASRVSTTRLL